MFRYLKYLVTSTLLIKLFIYLLKLNPCQLILNFYNMTDLGELTS